MDPFESPCFLVTSNVCSISDKHAPRIWFVGRQILTRQFHAQIVTELVDRPSLFFTLLGETLPKVCGFFCDYVIIRAFTGLSMELVRAYTIFPELLALVTCQKTWARSPVGVAVEVSRPSSSGRPCSWHGSLWS